MEESTTGQSTGKTTSLATWCPEAIGGKKQETSRFSSGQVLETSAYLLPDHGALPVEYFIPGRVQCRFSEPSKRYLVHTRHVPDTSAFAPSSFFPGCSPVDNAANDEGETFQDKSWDNNFWSRAGRGCSERESSNPGASLRNYVVSGVPGRLR